MNNEIKNIIINLKDGEIKPDEAVNLINQYNYPKIIKTKRCSKLKIYVYSKDDNKTIRLPAIPLWLITLLGSFALTIIKLVRFVPNIMNKKTEKYLNLLKHFNLREILLELKTHEPFDLVNVEEKDGDVVRISIL